MRNRIIALSIRLDAKQQRLTALRQRPDTVKNRSSVRKIEDDIRALEAELRAREEPPPRKPWPAAARAAVSEASLARWASPGFRQAMSDIQRASYEHRQDVTIKRRSQPE